MAERTNLSNSKSVVWKWGNLEQQWTTFSIRCDCQRNLPTNNYLYTYRLALLFAWCPVPLNSLHTCWSRLLQIHIPSPSRFQRHKNGYRHRLWLQFSSTHHHWQTFGRRSTLLLPPHCYLVLSILELFHQLLRQHQEHLRRKEGKLRVEFININWKWANTYMKKQFHILQFHRYSSSHKRIIMAYCQRNFVNR